MKKIQEKYQQFYALLILSTMTLIVHADEMDELEEKGTDAIQSIITLVLAWSIGLMTVALIGCGLAYAFTSQAQKAQAWGKNIGIGMAVVGAAGLISKAGYAAFGS